MGCRTTGGRLGIPARLMALVLLLATASWGSLVTGDAGAKEGPVPYDGHSGSGLHATIAAKKDLPKITLKYQERITLAKETTGYPGDLDAHATWQEQEAPLAVLLVGMPARARDPASRLWAQYLFEAGLHVMVFDSVFHPDFYGRTLHGVSGNMEREAEVMARVIQLALDESGERDRVTGVHLVGLSYGGNVALTINEMARRGQIDWAPERVLALSPTIEMRTTAGLLDRWAQEDLEPLSFFDLLPLALIKPLKPGQSSPLDDSLMRAGIAWALRGDLVKTVKSNDKLYHLGVIDGFESASDPDLKALSSARRWTFTQYWELMSFPYWRKRGGPETLDGFWDLSGIDHLMAAGPGNVRVVVTEDDPLNSADDLAALRVVADPDALVVLPSGGHLGYTRSQWVRSYIESWLVGGS